MAEKNYKDLVSEAKSRITEVDPVELQAELEAAEEVVIIDVREHDQFRAEHVPGAVPIARGVLEVKIHNAIPDRAANIVLYCGGGGRSALAVDTLQVMGYSHVRSLAGGFRGWQGGGFETTTSDS